MSKKAFEKFIDKKPKGAKLKEQIKVEKRQQRAEKHAAMKKSRAEKFQQIGREAAEKKFGKTSVEKQTGKVVVKSASDKKSTGAKLTNELMPLNKYLAHSAISGRREAAEIIKQGKVTVNGSIVYEPGYKVNGTEKILVDGKQTQIQKDLVYILLNKPKDHLCTVTDPQGRKTVMDLIKADNKSRLYPVGRLDRNTTGVLLITNDGELSQKLTHPSFNIKKIYEVGLDKPITKKDLDTIAKGVTLEDGFIKPDALSVDTNDKTTVGIEIHSGKNHIVKRIFKHLDYEVKKLDRVMFANLTKKNVERGKWRFLQEKEVRLLKYLNASFTKKVNKKPANEV